MNINVPRVYVNDYDGTQGETGVCPRTADDPVRGAMGLLLALGNSEQYKLDRSSFVHKWRAAESEGSFFPFTEVERQFTKRGDSALLYEKFLGEYAANHSNYPLTYDDTAKYLDHLNESSRMPSFTLTRGEYDSQVAKTTASKIPGHIEITSETAKGKIMELMRNPETGLFEFAATDSDDRLLMVVSTPSLTLVDDSPKSFEGLPADCQGILLDRPEEEKKASQRGSVNPRRVVKVTSLLNVHIPVSDRHTLIGEAADIIDDPATKFMPMASYILHLA